MRLRLDLSSGLDRTIYGQLRKPPSPKVDNGGMPIHLAGQLAIVADTNHEGAEQNEDSKLS